MNLSRLRLALPVAFIFATVDCTTKELAINLLPPAYVPHRVLGDFLRLTLAFNRQAAMSVPLGPHPRPLLVIASFLALIALLRLLWAARPTAIGQRLALGMILGGTVGNLASRIQSSRGVVDFIDVGVGMHRFYIFNVADIGLCCGAALLALTFWRDRQPAHLTSREVAG